MDLRMSLISGIDIPIPECQIIIHQPKVKEIALIGEETFFIGVQVLNVNKNLIQIQGETVLEDINNFQIFMTIMTEKKTADKKYAVQQLFSLLFPDYKRFQDIVFFAKASKTDHSQRP